MSRVPSHDIRSLLRTTAQESKHRNHHGARAWGGQCQRTGGAEERTREGRGHKLSKEGDIYGL